MFNNPMEPIKKGWLKGVLVNHVEPNAVDLRIEKIWKVDTTTKFTLHQEDKTHRERELVTTEDKDGKEIWNLEKGIYDFMSPAYVEMQPGTVGWLVTRSTLNRNGVYILSGLYDSGYQGHINGMLYNMGGTMELEKMSRVAQFIIGDSKSWGSYSGGYNTKEGDLPEYLNDNE